MLFTTKAALCAVLVPGLCNVAHAQTDPTLPVATAAGETIVVTASRSGDAIPIDRIGASITVLDPALLDFRQTRTVSDILRDVPASPSVARAAPAT